MSSLVNCPTASGTGPDQEGLVRSGTGTKPPWPLPRRKLTLLLPELVTAKSGLPSRLKSAATTVQGLVPTAPAGTGVKLGTQRSSRGFTRGRNRGRRARLGDRPKLRPPRTEEILMVDSPFPKRSAVAWRRRSFRRADRAPGRGRAGEALLGNEDSPAACLSRGVIRSLPSECRPQRDNCGGGRFVHSS